MLLDDMILHIVWQWQINGLVHERRNSSALAMELRLSCTNHQDVEHILEFELTQKVFCDYCDEFYSLITISHCC